MQEGDSSPEVEVGLITVAVAPIKLCHPRMRTAAATQAVERDVSPVIDGFEMRAKGPSAAPMHGVYKMILAPAGCGDP